MDLNDLAIASGKPLPWHVEPKNAIDSGALTRLRFAPTMQWKQRYLAIPRSEVFPIVVALLLAGSMWFYVQRVLIGHQLADASARKPPWKSF